MVSAPPAHSYKIPGPAGPRLVRVEPHPQLFEKLQANRRCFTENACLAEEPADVEFLINHSLPGCSGMRATLNDALMKRHYGPGKEYESVIIQAQPLWGLLRKHNAPKMIDYLSLDLEGAEHAVLRSFPFDEYAFRCMTIERSGTAYMALRTLLRSNGYRLVRIAGSDDFWIHGSMDYRPGLLRRGRTLLRILLQKTKQHLK